METRSRKRARIQIEHETKEEKALRILRFHLDKNGLHDWKTKIYNAYRAVGRCSYRRETIYLSKYHVENHSDEEILETILHEIAHALCMGHDHAHGDIWKQKALELGASGEQYHNCRLDLKYNYECSAGCRYS